MTEDENRQGIEIEPLNFLKKRLDKLKLFEKYLVEKRELIILDSIIRHSSSSPIHGYGINEEVKKRYGVRYHLRTVYDTLWCLERRGYIVGKRDKTTGRKKYTWKITSRGMKYFKWLNDAENMNNKSDSAMDLYDVQVVKPVIQTNRTS